MFTCIESLGNYSRAKAEQQGGVPGGTALPASKDKPLDKVKEPTPKKRRRERER